MPTLRERFSGPRLAYAGAVALGAFGGLLVGFAFIAPFRVAKLLWIPVILGVLMMLGSSALAFVAAGRMQEEERKGARGGPP